MPKIGYELTYREPEWCPHDNENAVEEAKYNDIDGHIHEIDSNA
jgi:hypothetical protein